MQHNTIGKILTLLFVLWLLPIVAWPINAQTPRNSTMKRCGGRSLERLVVERVPPTWPPERGMRVMGDVVVKITIDKNGKIVSARAICGHPLKMSFAVSAVIKWKLQPYVVNGKAKKVSGIVTVHFPAEDGERNKNGKEMATSWQPRLMQNVVTTNFRLKAGLRTIVRRV